MAKGKRCPECGDVAYAEKETYQPKGIWVVYGCRNKNCPSVKRGFPWQKRVFEVK